MGNKNCNCYYYKIRTCNEHCNCYYYKIRTFNEHVVRKERNIRKCIQKNSLWGQNMFLDEIKDGKN